MSNESIRYCLESAYLSGYLDAERNIIVEQGVIETTSITEIKEKAVEFANQVLNKLN